MKKNKMLIAVDGSAFGTAAIDIACEYIDPKRTSILIMSVAQHGKVPAAEPAFLSAEIYREYENASMKRAVEVVATAEQQLRKRFPRTELDLTTKSVKGIPDQEILRKAKTWHADLIVVGSHGYGFWGRLLGSISDSVAHHAPCSVLIAKQK